MVRRRRADEPARAGAASPGEGGLAARVVLNRGDFRLDLPLTVPPGQVVALLGPNGAGKTTALRAVAGLVRLAEGHVRVGADVWDVPARAVWVPAHRRNVGYVFADHRLFPHLSALDNVAFGLRARGCSRGQAGRQAAATLRRFGLTGLRDRRPSQLSAGQAQRVALARAVATQPRVMLLDEPLASLDAGARHDVRAELGSLLEGVTAPSLLVSHDPVDAMTMASQVVVLEGGRIVQTGTPLEVARRPATDYVARLVGLNLYRGQLSDPATGTVSLDGGGTLVAADRGSDDGGGADQAPDHGHGRSVGAPTLAVVAPSAISLFVHQAPVGSARNTWQGTVSGIATLTDRVRVTVRGHPDAIVDITPAALAQLRLRPGQAVWLSAKATEVKAYPAPRPASAAPHHTWSGS